MRWFWGSFNPVNGFIKSEFLNEQGKSNYIFIL